MKVEFENELKYTDLLLPTLEILSDNKNKTENEIINIFQENERFRKYNPNSIVQETTDALFYISKTNYVSYNNNNQFQITKDGLIFMNDLDHEKKKILKRNKPQHEIEEAIIKKENTYRNKIIKKIDNYYNIPSRQFFYKVILDYLNENPNHAFNRKNMNLDILSKLNYSDEEMGVLTRGKTISLYVRLNFAVAYLKNIKFISNDKNGEYYVTQKGLEYIDNPDLINIVEKEYKNKNKSNDKNKDKKSVISTKIEKEDKKLINQPENNFLNSKEEEDNKSSQSLSEKLSSKVKSCNPRFFEKIVYDLLMKMDYSGITPNHGELTPKTHDNGIDGIIYLGRLNTNPIYFQAKRWNNNVQKPEIHKFIGALYEKSANTGIFITTSDFSTGAKELAKSANIELINGKELVNFMIEFKIGTKTIEVVDEEYFE